MTVTKYENGSENGSDNGSDHDSGNASNDGSDNESSHDSDSTSNSDSHESEHHEPNSDDDEEHHDVVNIYLCCECGEREFHRMNECWRWKCSNCRHHKCEECEQYDGDDLSVINSDDEGDDYIINDPVAERDVVSHVENGPVSLKFALLLLDKKAAARYRRALVEVQSRIAAYALMPDERTISIHWSHEAQEWRYQGIPVPFGILDIPGSSVKSVTNEFLSPAPSFIATPSIPPFINYTMDTLSFEYNRCGTREEDDEEYLTAMGEATVIIGCHNSGTGPKVREFQISWCQRAEILSSVLDLVERDIEEGLEKVTLIAHDHYQKDSYYSEQRRRHYLADLASMKNAVRGGELDAYPFQVDLISPDNIDIRELLEQEALELELKYGNPGKVEQDFDSFDKS